MIKKMGLICLMVFVLGVNSSRADNYEDCVARAGKIGESAIAKCMVDKTRELMQSIKYAYENTLKETEFEKWNNGHGMASGNFRSMFDNWVAYRDRYCAVYALSLENYVGSREYNHADCVLGMTREHYSSILVLRTNLNSIVE